jgi:transcriptional regulator with XRE-family HTH domain
MTPTKERLRKQMGIRFKQFRTEIAGMNTYEIGRELDIDPSQIVKIEKGIVGLTVEAMAIMATKFNINAHWLITGEGNQFYFSSKKK